MRSLRVFPTDVTRHPDPFVVFERFHIEPEQGFGTHPHYGFEIVSYMLEGGMEHDDSLGETTVARAGDGMRITTGEGYEHSELPADDEYCSGLQLWVNLPREAKSTDPSVRVARAAEFPVEEEPAATVRTVVGEGSPLDLRTPVTYHDVQVDGDWTWQPPDGWAGVLYVVSGTGSIDGRAFGSGEYVLVDGGAETLVATDDGVRVVALAGRPHGEPIRQRGPFVE